MAGASERNKKNHWFRVLVLVLNFFAVLALLCSYAAAYISPEKAWVLAFFGIA